MLGTIAYRGWRGTGPAVVFVHGNPASAAIQRSISRGRLAKLRLVALDLPGHGDSHDAANSATYSLPGYAVALSLPAAICIDSLAIIRLIQPGGDIAYRVSPRMA